MKLYHATYTDLLPMIEKNGLGNSPYKNWSDSQNKFVYLASDPDEAYSYAETFEDEDNVQDYQESEIVVFEIDSNELDVSKLFKDSNIIDNQSSFQYEGVIPYEKLKMIDLNEQINEVLKIAGVEK